MGWPGSVHDGRVFANSYLKANLERLLNSIPSSPMATKAPPTSHETQHENVPAFILADSAYPSTSRVVPTFKNHQCSTRDIRKLNAKLAGIRYSVENTFGICKGRFRLLNRPLECAKDDVIKASYLITAIFVLHNFLIDEDDETLVTPVEDSVEDDDEENEGGIEQAVEHDDEIKTRDILLRHIYWHNS